MSVLNPDQLQLIGVKAFTFTPPTIVVTYVKVKITPVILPYATSYAHLFVTCHVDNVNLQNVVTFNINSTHDEYIAWTDDSTFIAAQLLKVGLYLA